MVDEIIWTRGQHLGGEVRHHWRAALHNEGCIILQRGLGYFVERQDHGARDPMAAGARIPAASKS